MCGCTNCCGPNCNGLCKCFIAGVKTECRTTVSEAFLTFMGCEAIELGFEFGWYDNNNENIQSWLKESLISSGISATYAVVVSSFLWMMFKKHGHHTNGISQVQETTYFNTATLISQLLSGAVAFCVGIAFDLAFHKILDNLENSSKIGLSIIVPAMIVSTKVISRIGIFKLVEAVKSRCQQKQEYENLNEYDETTSLLINS